MTVDEYKSRIRQYLQSSEASDEVWEYVMVALCDASATMGMDFLEQAVFGQVVEVLQCQI